VEIRDFCADTAFDCFLILQVFGGSLALNHSTDTLYMILNLASG